MRAPFVAELPNLTWGRGVYLEISHVRLPLKRVEFQRPPPHVGVLLYAYIL